MQIANIAITDGAATPVTHTFAPSKVAELLATWYGPGLTLSGRESIVVTRREPTATVAGKVSIKLTLPIEKTVDGINVVDYVDTVFQEFVLAPKSVKQDRKNARVLSSNLLLNAQIAAMIDDAEGAF
jgi:hypothetical protein